MPRPQKHQLEYFPLDVDFFNDDKIALVAGEFGVVAEVVAVKLLCRIYSTGGYFTEWNNDTSTLFCMRSMFNSVDVETLNKIVNALINRGFFSREAFDQYGILTSRGIVKRFNLSHKYRAVFNEEHKTFLKNIGFLEDKKDTAEKTPYTAEKTPYTAEKTPYTAEKTPLKKRKEKKRKEKDIPLPPSFEDFETEDEPDEGYLERITEIVSCWNRIFPDKDRRILDPPLGLNSLACEALREGASAPYEFTIEEYERAFLALKKEPKFSWSFHAAVRPDNVRQMLTEAKNERALAIKKDSRKNLPSDRSEYSVDNFK